MLLMKVQQGVRDDIRYFGTSKMALSSSTIQVSLDFSPEVSMDFLDFRKGSFCRKTSQCLRMFAFEP